MSFLQWSIPVHLLAEPETFQGFIWQYPIEGIEEDDQILRVVAKPEFQMEIQKFLKSHNVPIQPDFLALKNWNEAWESSFEPITIDNFCAVRAHFHAPVQHTLHEIIITPRMSFGTGHHATTQLMIQAMAGINFKNKQVFDFGTGTGVLAILAEKLGAHNILGVDNDRNSVDNANDNLTQNKTQHTAITDDAIENIDNNYDIILANINRHVLVENMERMSAMLAPRGQLLLSGILTEDFDLIKNVAQTHQLQLQELYNLNNWACHLYIKN